MKHFIQKFIKSINKDKNKQERIDYANNLIELYNQRNPDNPIDFGNIDYDNTNIPIEERKLVINAIETNIYADGISDPLYNIELKSYIYKVHDYLRYQPENYTNLLLKSNVYMLLSDGENLNKYLNELILKMTSDLLILAAHPKDKERFFHILRISVSAFVLLKTASTHFMETKGYLIDIDNFYEYFNTIENYYNKINKNLTKQETKHIKFWLVMIFSNYSWHASYYGNIIKLNDFLEKKFYIFEGNETEILCTLSTRSFYQKDCAYSRLALKELKKLKKCLQKEHHLITFYHALKLTNALTLDNTSLYKYYVKYKKILLQDAKTLTHLDILRLLIENPKYYQNLLSEIKDLYNKEKKKKNKLKISFLLMNIYLKSGLHDQAYKLFKESYSSLGCTDYMEAIQYINIMDNLSILLKEKTLFEHLYYTYIFKPLYRGKLVTTNINLFLKAQSKISKIYNFNILKSIYNEYMQQNVSLLESKNIVVINPYTDINNYYSPIHIYKELIKREVPIINLTANEIGFFNNTTNQPPVMLSYSNDCVIGVEKHWNEDFNKWEISFERKKIVCNGVNYYQTFFETVARAQKKFNIDWHSQLSQYYFALFKRRMDRNIYAYNELKKVLPKNASIKFFASMYHYTPWSYYYTSFRHRNNPQRESLIQINSAYENYNANIINNTFSSITALNLTLNKDSRAVAFGASEHFSHWVKDRIEGYTLKTSAQRKISDVVIKGELKVRLDEARTKGKKIVCVLGKLLYDLCVPYMGGTFDNMYAWAKATNQFVLERNDIFLLVKPNPVEVNYDISNVVNESFHDWFSDDKDKIYKIGHNEIGLGDLAPYVDIFALWNGSSVIELAKDRRNIIVCDDWANKDYPIGLKQPQSQKSYFKSIIQSKKWNPNSNIAIKRAKIAELFEEYLSSREFTVENVGVIRSSTNTNWNTPYLKPNKVIEEFKKPTQNWEKIMDKIFERKKENK